MPADLIQEAEGLNTSSEVYADNWTATRVFSDMLTQWRVGPCGATGLDYAALPAVLNIRKVKDREDVFECLQIMERAALKTIQKASND